MPDIEYDYAHVPTIWRFSQAHKFIRGLMGPFGSGKSSARVMEVVQWAALDTRAETPRTRRAIHRASSPMSRACAERKLRQAEASMQLTTVGAGGTKSHANAINSAPVDDVQENRATGGPRHRSAQPYAGPRSECLLLWRVRRPAVARPAARAQ